MSIELAGGGFWLYYRLLEAGTFEAVAGDGPEAQIKWGFTPQVRDQLDACASSTHVATITLSSVDVGWLASDLTRAPVGQRMVRAGAHGNSATLG